jgi:menaquinone-9 beta-reductase
MSDQNPYLGRWLSGSTMVTERWLSISEVPFIAKRPVVNEILMAGDAAGLIAPLAGDGIALALHSGLIAGKFASKFLDGQISGDRLLDEYAGIWRNQFQSRFRLSWTLQPLMFVPVLSSTALKILRAAPQLGNYLIRKTRDMRLVRNEEYW